MASKNNIQLPIVDTIAKSVDMRIRATDFNSESTLTKDTVPVNVDAICFWMVWDAKKAILEVENFYLAIVLSAIPGVCLLPGAVPECPRHVWRRPGDLLVLP